MHVIHDGQIRDRGAIVAFLLSATIHLGLLYGLGLRSPLLQNSASADPLNVTLVRPSPESPPLPGPSDSAQSFDQKQSEPAPPSSLSSSDDHPRQDRTGHAGLQSQPGTVLPHYFLNSEVDIPAEPLTLPSIVLPEQAFISKLYGTVRVRVFIDFQGNVDSIEILESHPRYPPFEEVAMNALKETRYVPAKLYGQAVNSQKIVEVIFNPYEDSAYGGEVQPRLPAEN